jgi:hypothetical protein
MTKRVATSAQAARGPHTFGERWSWTQFSCALVLAGFLAFLHVDPPLDGLGVHLSKTVTIAGICAALAGRFGDAAWHWILRLLHWS